MKHRSGTGRCNSVMLSEGPKIDANCWFQTKATAEKGRQDDTAKSGLRNVILAYLIDLALVCRFSFCTFRNGNEFR